MTINRLNRSQRNRVPPPSSSPPGQRRPIKQGGPVHKMRVTRHIKHLRRPGNQMKNLSTFMKQRTYQWLSPANGACPPMQSETTGGF